MNGKGKFKIFGIIAIAAVIVFSTAACGDAGVDTGGGGGGSGGVTSAPLGETLTLSGPVWINVTYNHENHTWEYEPFDGNATIAGQHRVGNDVFEEINGTGAITEGELSFTIGVPAPMFNMSEWFIDQNIDVTTSNDNTMGVYLSLAPTPGDYLDKMNQEITASSEVTQYVDYVYVDRDLTIIGAYDYFTHTENGETGTEITNAFNINLIEGWNAIYIVHKAEWTDTSETNTFTMYAANPGHLRWELFQFQ